MSTSADEKQTRLCMKSVRPGFPRRLTLRPGETTDADPYDAVNRWGFIGQARDKGDPWFQQVYEVSTRVKVWHTETQYRLLDDLYRDDLVTNGRLVRGDYPDDKDPTTPPKAPVVLPKRGYARVNGKVLETRIAALEVGHLDHPRLQAESSQCSQSSSDCLACYPPSKCTECTGDRFARSREWNIQHASQTRPCEYRTGVYDTDTTSSAGRFGKGTFAFPFARLPNALHKGWNPETRR